MLRLVVVVLVVRPEVLGVTALLPVVLRVTCGVVALVLRLTVLVLVLRVAAGATVLLERETAAVWLLLLVLPP